MCDKCKLEMECEKTIKRLFPDKKKTKTQAKGEKSMFTHDQLKRLIVAQNTLNEYYVPDWKNKVPKEKFLSAFQCEWAEFLESAPRFYDHKWWKPKMQDDTQKT